MLRLFTSVVLLCVMSTATLAGGVDIVKTRFEQQPGGWHISTTLRHADKGWSHYADAWRVVDGQGKVLATRTLHHPHDNEQPFTRSLGGVLIPADSPIIFIEAHDTVHGWSPQRLRVDLSRAQGERFEVLRPKP